MPFFALIINLFFFLVTTNIVRASYDPTTIPNNKVGLHVLFPGEISTAAKIVNGQDKGSWGYVTIPIQATDRNRDRWQQFLDKCREFKIIPIIRVATAPVGSNWSEPNNFDLVDFANFLNDLRWPTQNRYIIIFNEVNRSDEYGGSVSPEKYANILSNAIDIFKSKSTDFFILPAGLDNAAANSATAINWKNYLQRMYQEQPDIFDKIDGWTSHAYPNPDFSSRPDLSGANKINSYLFDLRFIAKFTTKKLPVFITETGWSNRYLSDHQISLYYQYAFTKIWSDPQVVAVTPFLLDAQDGPFKQFSFLKRGGELTEFANLLGTFATAGEPLKPTKITPTIQITNTYFQATDSSTLADNEDSLSLFGKIYHRLAKLLGILGK